MSVQSHLSELAGKAFAELGLSPELGEVLPSQRPELAQFQCNGAMAAAKEAGRAPRDIAEDIANALRAPICSALISCVPSSILPSFSISCIHFAMPSALQLIPPAAAEASVILEVVICKGPVKFTCGVAVCAWRLTRLKVAVHSFMPSGSNKRCSSNSSKDCPETLATTSPATMNKRLS
jgi:hypothetical protein